MSRLLSAFDLTLPDAPRPVSLWSSIQGIDRRQTALDEHSIYLGSGEVRRRDMLDLLGTLSPGIPSFSSGGAQLVVGTYDGFFATEGHVIGYDAAFQDITSQPVICAPERMTPVADNDFLILGFDAVCMGRYISTYTFDWPDDPGVEPVPHPDTTLP